MEMERLLGDLRIRNLRPTGTNIQACCPFHKENTPSWGIMIHYPYIMNCFCCGKSGTVINLIMHIEDCNVMEAFSIADKYGYKESDKEREVKKYTPTMTEIELEKYTIFFNKAILKRGLSIKTLKEWEVGYDIENRSHIFTIRDENKKLIGVGAKPLKERYSRYIFYKGTRKGQTLYGLYKCNLGKPVIVVEGFMDALKLWELGVRNVVALMGNQATDKQIELLAQNFNKVYTALDNDEKGRWGTRSLIRKLRGKVKIFILEYPKWIKDGGEFRRRSQVKKWLKGSKVVFV